MFMFSKPDEGIDLQVLAGMLNNYGIKDGKITRISLLPENSKTLADLFVKNENGSWSFENIDRSEIIRFRSMVQYTASKIKGIVPENNKYLANTNIFVNALMFFKNWIPNMAKERFKGVMYDELFEDIDEGRYIAVWDEFVGSAGVWAKSKSFINIALLNALGRKPTVNKQYLEVKFFEFLDENPDLEGKVTLDQFIEMNESKLKAFAMELRILYIIAILAFGLSKAIPDDDEDALASFIAKNTYAGANRALLELTFWLSPSSVNEIITRPPAIIGLANDFAKMFSNTLDETRDIILGDNNKNDKTGLFYYSSKLTPIINPAVKMFDVFDNFQK